MKKCLIIVDYQNDFVDGTLGFENADKLESVIETKINNYLNNNDDILFTLDTHYEDYLNTSEGINLPIKHCIKNTKGHELYGSIKKYENRAKAIFEKNTFGSIELGNFLVNNNYDEIELVGLVTNMCIVSNAIIAKAALPETKIIIDRSAVDSFNKDLHNKTFDLLKGMYIDII